MRFFVFCFLWLTCSLSYSQQPSPEARKVFADLVGVWEIQRVTDKGKDISSKDSTHISSIEFDREGRFKSVMGNAADSGSYRVNENHQILYLQSDTNKDQVAQWQMVFKDNTLMLTARDNPAAERFRYYYRRTRQAASR